MTGIFSETFIVEAAQESLAFLKQHSAWDQTSEHFTRIQAFLFLVREDIAEFSAQTQATITDIAREAARLDAIRIGREPSEFDVERMLEEWKFETTIDAFQSGADREELLLDENDDTPTLYH